MFTTVRVIETESKNFVTKEDRVTFRCVTDSLPVNGVISFKYPWLL